MFLNIRHRYGTVCTLQLGLHELLFDPLNGTTTSLELAAERHGSTCTNNYESSNPLLLSRLLDKLPPDAAKGAFLDCGAGKGRALLIASRHGFEKVIGVEISPVHCETAGKNIEIFLKKHPDRVVKVYQGDAATFEIPDEVSVAYFFNPFGRDVMLAVIDRILKSLLRVPREFHVVYMIPVLADIFIASGFVRVYGCGSDGAILYRPIDVKVSR